MTVYKMTVNETIKRLQELSELGYGDKPIKIYNLENEDDIDSIGMEVDNNEEVIAYTKTFADTAFGRDIGFISNEDINIRESRTKIIFNNRFYELTYKHCCGNCKMFTLNDYFHDSDRYCERLGYKVSDLKYPPNVKRKDCVCDKFVLK